ncbi:MAG: heme o synthase [Alphaproteobacteria bacterium]|nr:heme o synthase [Alphaproteobacteria bacterium]
MSQTDTATAYIAQHELRPYLILLKPKVMSLVVFTAFAGMAVAPGFSSMHPFLVAVTLLCIAVNAGAAGAINMWYDRDIDGLMRRTAARPIPTGMIMADDGLGFGIFLSLLSVMVMALATNILAAALLAAANLFYVFVYTIWLKRRTPQNIVIGGAAGAFPPLIGWAAVTGDISLYPLILFSIIFFWTPPHFWALALFASDDYKRAGIPMMPLTHGTRATKIQMLAYTLVLLPLTLLPFVLGYEGMAYSLCALGLSGFFIYTAWRVLRAEGHGAAKRMFGYSIFYLFALFLAVVIF